MSKLNSTLQSLKDIRSELRAQRRIAIEQDKEWIEERNRKQLIKGTKADGTAMPRYVNGSKQPNAPGKIVLFEDGDFHRGIKTEVGKDAFDNTSTDSKTAFLKPKYGKIFGLTDDNKELLGKRVKIKLEKFINKKLK